MASLEIDNRFKPDTVSLVDRFEAIRVGGLAFGGAA